MSLQLLVGSRASLKTLDAVNTCWPECGTLPPPAVVWSVPAPAPAVSAAPSVRPSPRRVALKTSCHHQETKSGGTRLCWTGPCSSDSPSLCSARGEDKNTQHDNFKIMVKKMLLWQKLDNNLKNVGGGTSDSRGQVREKACCFMSRTASWLPRCDVAP